MKFEEAAICFILGSIFGVALLGGFIMNNPNDPFFLNDAMEFGNAICEENFGEDSTYKSFDGETLECEKPEATEQYDGLKVRLG